MDGSRQTPEREDPVWQEERAHLREVLDCVVQELSHIDARFEEGVQAGDENAEESVRAMLARRYRQLLLVQDNPYFARIDFEERAGGRPPRLARAYLGKTTVTDGERNLRVVDWRAPVASLYYECRLGEAAYQSPERRVEGVLRLKRRYTLLGRALAGFEDVDITSDDELLRPHLTVSADERLKNIISTIQADQNAIIRAPLDAPLIVQGAAGSGKTTVALHRIAWMVYTYAQRFSPERFMILAPNRFFLHYISGVLPDLGVEDVPQKTFAELARDLTRIKLTVEDPVHTLERIMAEWSPSPAEDVPGGGEDVSALRAASYKSSLRCRAELDAFLAGLEEHFIPDAPFSAGGVPYLSAETLREMFLKDRAHLSIRERLQWMQKRITFLLQDSPLGKMAAAAYCKALPLPKPQEVYRRFLVNAGRPAGAKGNRMAEEDLAPLLHIWLWINGSTHTMKRMRHIVLDEAQDASPFQLRLLRDLYPGATFTLLGDLAQRLFFYRGLSSWEMVSSAVWDGAARLHTLPKSYRTTIEIMAYANTLIADLPDIPSGEAVVRHGGQVAVFPVVSDKERAWTLTERVRFHQAAGHRNIAVIAKTQAAAHALSKGLLRAGLAGVAEITGREDRYEGGVSLLSAALSKGLEFDAVLLADGRSYGNSAHDRRLKYVACTRAMHALDIVE